MSYFQLSNIDSIPNQLPSLNNIPQSMLLLGSINNINGNNSMTIINPINNQQDQDSLGMQLQKQIKKQEDQSPMLNYQNSSRKKKEGCTCKKTGCLKMYCLCFSVGKVCQQSCSCLNCFNNQQYVDEIKKSKDQIKKKHISQKKCNCKKSHCDKKYCQCFNAGLLCNSQCKCLQCSNGGHTSHGQLPDINEPYKIDLFK